VKNFKNGGNFHRSLFNLEPKSSKTLVKTWQNLVLQSCGHGVLQSVNLKFDWAILFSIRMKNKYLNGWTLRPKTVRPQDKKAALSVVEGWLFVVPSGLEPELF
jgi:hypothetical protein